MPSDNKIDYVELPAKDLAAVKQFYSQVFGWVFEDFGEEYVAFSNAGLTGGFYKIDLASDSDAGAALVILYAVNLEQTLARVQEYGGQIVKPVFEFPGGRRFHFKDPAGNELAVWSAGSAPV
ncbi:MAG: VOC family protein [Burkholderiaceae bacterium]